jgi:hypothetical protein
MEKKYFILNEKNKYNKILHRNYFFKMFILLSLYENLHTSTESVRFLR